MSHFYGETQGNRGIGGKCGTKKSGYWGHLRGWNIGARVDLNYLESKEHDVLDITLTGGSNGHNDKLPRLNIRIHENGEYTIHINDKTFTNIQEVTK